METMAALRPLLEAADDVRRLDDYQTTEELAAAIGAVGRALERSLRVRLRRDVSAPEDDRLRALSPEQMSLEEVIKSLRARDVISLETAGTLHEARPAIHRAGEGAARASDADVVRVAADRLRRELEAEARSESETGEEAGIEANVDTAAEAGEPEPEESAEADRRRDTSPLTGRWMAWIAAAIAAAFLVGAAWMILRGSSQEYEDAVQAFRAGRFDSAAVAFERVLSDRPEDITSMLYLARSYRRTDRPTEAAEVLRQAVEVDGEDADVRRELGHLFMDLGRPAAAISQYETALEYDPGEPRNWAALIRALRAAGDPRAEQLLQEAPPAVQAALGGA